MNLTAQFESAEIKFRKVLETFFTSIYDERSLGSHGLDHHRHVWNNARIITQYLEGTGKLFDDNFAEKLIIVCFLHDIGMMEDPGPKHGKQSRKICEKFFYEQNINSFLFSDVLETIENHDNKDYSKKTHENDLLSILSVADDLEAFGYTGIYRYSEIYLKRGLEPNKIGRLITQNASARFDNFVREFHSFKELLSVHEKRFLILINFFSSYSIEAENYDFNCTHPTGQCGVIQLFNFMIENKIGLKETIQYTENNITDTFIRKFFNELENDLSGKIYQDKR